MNKFWKSTTVFVLIVTFLVSTMICCCVTRLAQGAMVQTKVKSSCCHAKASNSEHKAKDCGSTCPKKNLRAETLPVFTVVSPSTYAFKLLPIDFISLLPSAPFVMKLVSFHSPPAHHSNLPLYLKTHSLRI